MSTAWRRRVALLPVVAGVAAATLALRLPNLAEAVGHVLPAAGNSALAAETPAPAPAPVPTPAAVAPAPAPLEAAAPAAPAPAFDPDKLTPGEVDVLQNLSRRREEIEARARELDSREALVAAAEARVDKKLTEIKAIEEKIAAAQAAQTAEQDQQMARLVKVYETMKPGDAAIIFNTLDFAVLIEVASRMKEAKIAPVLAAMDPEAAKALTVALATRRAGPSANAPATGSGG
ncbi:MotE family protein [Zavarzinia aquatilis]|uniref:Magnesium transporter MgtE intracellular domain-containing protein n=1 Tax=Zavarzinia aquatilis TaxID=2211142 RepID=A0A317E9X7_9PROT|nr:hypothetical protein [Zavarzinia aquatilis]PWR22950.1 hypothetical protein DKG74_11080 [Zavarzinia aquatilis]